MTTDYYTHGGFPTPRQFGASSSARAEFDAVQAGFAKLPNLIGNSLKWWRVNAAETGVEAVSSATLLAAIGAVDAATVAATYQTIAGMSAYQTVAGMSAYETTAHASATYAPKGLATASGLTSNTAKLMGRNTAGVGALEEIPQSNFAASGLATASGLTQSTAKILGRTTAATGAIEEISVGSGLTLAAGSLSASASSGGFDDLIFGGELNTGNSATFFERYGLCQTSGLSDGRNTDGTFTFAGGGASNGIWSFLQKPSGTYLTPFLASKNPTYEMVVAQFGTGAGTRYFGMMNSAASPGTDGIYFRHTNGGNIIAVARAASTESTVDTGIAASTTLRQCKMVVTGGNSIAVSVDGVAKGTLSTNIPSAAMGFYLDGGSTAATDGIRASFVKIQQTR